MGLKKIAKELSENLKGINSVWNGKQAISAMKKAGDRNWKQMEWIGFYFEFLCKTYLSNILEFPGPVFDRVTFDGFYIIPWDLKAHAINTSSHQIIINDAVALNSAIEKYGTVGIILALGEVIYNDEERKFQHWHQKLKGGKSAYEIERIKRGAWSRLRKVSFNLKQISFIKIDKNTLLNAGSFQASFRNADGSSRNKKILLNLENINKEIIHFTNFD